MACSAKNTVYSYFQELLHILCAVVRYIIYILAVLQLQGKEIKALNRIRPPSDDLNFSLTERVFKNSFSAGEIQLLFAYLPNMFK